MMFGIRSQYTVVLAMQSPIYKSLSYLLIRNSQCIRIDLSRKRKEQVSPTREDDSRSKSGSRVLGSGTKWLG